MNDYTKAIFKIGNDSHQYSGQPGEWITVEKLRAVPGEEIVTSKVLMAWNGDVEHLVGQPYVPDVRVVLLVTSYWKGPKIDAFNYKAKKNERKRWGHRQIFTRLKVLSIDKIADEGS